MVRLYCCAVMCAARLWMPEALTYPVMLLTYLADLFAEEDHPSAPGGSSGRYGTYFLR